MTHSLTTFTVERSLDHRAQTIWNLVKDPCAIARFHPLVKTANPLEGPPTGLEAGRVCALHPMGKMEERITDLSEGKYFTATMTGGKGLPPMRHLSGTFELQPSDEETIVRFTLRYQVGMGFLGQWMDRMMIRKQFSEAPKAYLLGLAHYLDTGQKLSPKEAKKRLKSEA